MADDVVRLHVAEKSTAEIIAIGTIRPQILPINTLAVQRLHSDHTTLLRLFQLKWDVRERLCGIGEILSPMKTH